MFNRANHMIESGGGKLIREDIPASVHSSTYNTGYKATEFVIWYCLVDKAGYDGHFGVLITESDSDPYYTLRCTSYYQSDLWATIDSDGYIVLHSQANTPISNNWIFYYIRK